jgi:hypothetical protein
VFVAVSLALAVGVMSHRYLPTAQPVAILKVNPTQTSHAHRRPSKPKNLAHHRAAWLGPSATARLPAATRLPKATRLPAATRLQPPACSHPSASEVGGCAALPRQRRDEKGRRQQKKVRDKGTRAKDLRRTRIRSHSQCYSAPKAGALTTRPTM